MAKNYLRSKNSNPTCRNCGNFLNLDQTPGNSSNWCRPHGDNSMCPCMPWEDASHKICYTPTIK